MTNATEQTVGGIYDFSAVSVDGRETPLAEYRGKVLVVVNTASKCGFTPQYAGLETLYKRYKDKDVVVLGFPCNQFGSQEPGTESEIAQFCELNYGVSFPIFAKIEVNGANAHPLYKFLKSEKAGIFGTEAIKWNFTKILIDAQGNVVGRFAPSVTPADLAPEIDKLIA